MSEFNRKRPDSVPGTSAGWRVRREEARKASEAHAANESDPGVQERRRLSYERTVRYNALLEATRRVKVQNEPVACPCCNRPGAVHASRAAIVAELLVGLELPIDVRAAIGPQRSREEFLAELLAVAGLEPVQPVAPIVQAVATETAILLTEEPLAPRGRGRPRKSAVPAALLDGAIVEDDD